MGSGLTKLQKGVVILVVFAISLIVGWYGERAVERFFQNNHIYNSNQEINL